MVLDALENSALYEGMHPRFKAAFDFVKSTDWTKQDPGKIYLDEKNLFINFAEGKGKTKEEAKMETHNEYIDIQIPFTQPETMGYIPAKDLKSPIEPYNAEKDITKYTDQGQDYFTVQPGQFAIFFPEDGHQPGIGEGAFRKIIVKVKVK
ncbi:MAG: YhcH/YjgK/YiaL family protein [Paludibacteraceae bacterium]|jgi:YhcH/YjgK/YiaL family protein|nr:YhcH/YjgK/YiaL family protein [Paludibacteraceae bacterium]